MQNPTFERGKNIETQRNLGLREAIIEQDNFQNFQNDKEWLIQEITDIIDKIHYQIQQLNNEFNTLKSQILRKIDEAINLMNDWYQSLQKIKSKENSTFWNIDFKRSGQHQILQCLKKDFEDEINKINQSYQQKIIQAKESLKKEVEQTKNDILFKNFSIKESYIQKNEQRKEQYKLINEIPQKEICYSIAFNKQGTIMVSCSQDEIKIWRFQNGRQIDCIQKIQGDSEIDYATSLVFSKKNNFFISGSYDSSVKLYQNFNGKWLKQLCNKKHGGLVTCVILNNQEDELISCSQDFLIFIWKINLIQTTLEFEYQLQKHEKVIFSLSINKQDTELVSTGQDQKIIVWRKSTKQKQWSFYQLIDQQCNDVGCRISYITDTIIVWQQNNQPYIHFFELQNDKYVEKHQMQLEQSKSQIEAYSFFFPTQYNYEKRILIQKFNNKIYLIHFDDLTCQFKVHSNYIECSSSFVFGNLTQDGKYLVFWDFISKNYQVFEQCYE